MIEQTPNPTNIAKTTSDPDLKNSVGNTIVGGSSITTSSAAYLRHQ